MQFDDSNDDGKGCVTSKFVYSVNDRDTIKCRFKHPPILYMIGHSMHVLLKYLYHDLPCYFAQPDYNMHLVRNSKIFMLKCIYVLSDYE